MLNIINIIKYEINHRKDEIKNSIISYKICNICNVEKKNIFIYFNKKHICINCFYNNGIKEEEFKKLDFFIIDDTCKICNKIHINSMFKNNQYDRLMCNNCFIKFYYN